MAEERKFYPQIPARVWWQVRSIMQNRPSAKLTDSVLATQLSVQASAAKAYLKQFKMIGLIDDNGAATDLAHKWRNDASYEEAKTTIMKQVYPEELVAAYPPNEADHEKVASYFQIGGLGAGSAKNRAATYVLIANSKPDEAEAASGPRARSKSSSKVDGERSAKRRRKETPSGDSASSKSDLPELNVNLQIHISPDATNEQIEAIFEAMRKYLRQ